MTGFVNIIKPPGMTSHDVVAFVRKSTSQRKVGHTGTLDPAAAGVLVVTLGGATRFGEYLLGCDKEYRAEFALGITTSTDDAEGEVTGRASAAHITQPQTGAVIAEMAGEVVMRPPVHSAVRVAGKRLYDHARSGRPVDCPQRTVNIRSFSLRQFIPGGTALARVHVVCSKGTYIRSLARMVGEKLGCGAFLSCLVRTRVGPHTLSDAVTLEHFAQSPAECLLDFRTALKHLPVLVVESQQAQRLRHGNPVPFEASDDDTTAGVVLLVDEYNCVIGSGRYDRETGKIAPEKIVSVQ